MEFAVSDTTPEGVLIGEATRTTGMAHDLCRRYAEVSARLIDPSGDRMVPFVIRGPWPFVADGETPLRRSFDPDDQPIMAASVEDPTDGDVIVVIPSSLAATHVNDDNLALTAIIDIASWVAENYAPVRSDLFGAGAKEISRAAAAAFLLRCAEADGVMGARKAALSYRIICATATAGIAARFFPENAEALLMDNAPGLITLIDCVVKQAMSAAPLPLPLRSGQLGRISEQIGETTLASFKPLPAPGP